MIGRFRAVSALLALLIGGAALIGCTPISTPPTPMTQEELKDALHKATPQQRRDWINRSPGTAEQKAALRKEFGVSDPADSTPGGK